MAEKKQLFDEPSDVEAKSGDVHVDGPDAVHVAMTPDAAEETSERLSGNAVKARGQRRLKDLPHKEED